jgi:hypothetical protein
MEFETPNYGVMTDLDLDIADEHQQALVGIQPILRTNSGAFSICNDDITIFPNFITGKLGSLILIPRVRAD